MILTPDPSWQILDASKVTEYVRCPRRFFYRNVLGWTSEVPDKDKHFGKCWHVAMEHILLNGYNPVSVLQAVELANKAYREVFSEITDVEREPKTPAYILKALSMYVLEHKHDRFKVLYTEVGGAVPIAKDRVIHFKMDSILQDLESGLFLSLEHKTGSRNSRQWQDQWKMSMQIMTYLHVLYCLFPETEVFGVKINGAIFTKGKICEFPRIPVRYPPKLMNVWLDGVNYWVDQIESDFYLLDRHHDPSEPLHCFRQRYESCTEYYGCPYFDFCLGWDAPLEHVGNPPMGMKVEFWNPAEREVKACLTF